MIEASLSWARDAGANRAELWVTLSNDAARQLLLGTGFEATDEMEPLRAGSELMVAKMVAQIG